LVLITAFRCLLTRVGTPQPAHKPSKAAKSAKKREISFRVFADGDFDADFGGHLILPDLRLVIRFPPGSTILIPSASFTHGNVAIREGETRTSFTQFCPGGLFRHMDYGFRLHEELSEQEQADFAARTSDRVREALGRFSKLSDIHV
jgi:hypothetical protein